MNKRRYGTHELASRIDPTSNENPSNFKSFFDGDEQKKIYKNYLVPRENLPKVAPYYGCTTNLFFGFFFDGTRNNHASSLKSGDYTSTNVARLYDAYPGLSVPGVLPSAAEWPEKEKFKNFFRIYVPGVGTPFDAVNDTGEKVDALFGNAAALWGERRIIWALVQAINCIHRFYKKDTNLFSPEETLSLCRKIHLGWAYLKAGTTSAERNEALRHNKLVINSLLLKLHKAIAAHIPDSLSCRVKQIDPGVVQNIYVSAFGFSRGAAEARVFTNWFVEICRMDAEIMGKAGLTLGGFPVTFDFLGVFDTVASVGLASTSLFADGHASWADAECSLRVPPDIKCLHLVAAHEVRRSFPLDSIQVKNFISDHHTEIVMPGVHSDVGGGYKPKEQGRGLDEKGADLLSRIPLAMMYRAAMLAGVPLKLDKQRGDVKDRFKVNPVVINAFNDYVDQFNTKMGSLTAIMHEQRQEYILWRKLMNKKMQSLPSTQNSPPEDRADILGADDELSSEINYFLYWRKYLKPHGGYIYPRSIDPSHLHDIRLIDKFWDYPAPDMAVENLFSNFVHDSFAWFKLTGTEAADLKKEMLKLVERQRRCESYKFGDGHPPTPLQPEQKKWVDNYLRTGEFPKEMTAGREFVNFGAGYMRYRKVYGGSNSYMLTEMENSAYPDIKTA